MAGNGGSFRYLGHSRASLLGTAVLREQNSSVFQ